jgi:hypothetical protein
MRDEKRDGGASSQGFWIKRFTFTAVVRFKDFVNQALQFACVRHSRIHPTFVFFDFLQYKARELILPIFRHLL